MSHHPDRQGRYTVLATGAALLLPALCCGLPLLIASGTLAGLGSALGHPWLIASGAVLLMGAVAALLRQRTRCCSPQPPSLAQSHPTLEPPSLDKES
jgi:hypothetical protein